MDIIFASNNQGKTREVRAILEDTDIKIHSLSDLELHIDVVEDGNSFLENAMIKATTIAGLIRRPVLADDSGLEVDALGGAPGIYSARYGGKGLKDEERMNLLLSELENVPEEKRTARFVCVMALVLPDGTNHVTRGVCEGTIADAPQGDGGFGYDPLFRPRGFSDTFGVISAETKNRISHRRLALQKMREIIQKV